MIGRFLFHARLGFFSKEGRDSYELIRVDFRVDMDGLSPGGITTSNHQYPVALTRSYQYSAFRWILGGEFQEISKLVLRAEKEFKKTHEFEMVKEFAIKAVPLIREIKSLAAFSVGDPEEATEVYEERDDSPSIPPRTYYISTEKLKPPSEPSPPNGNNSYFHKRK